MDRNGRLLLAAKGVRSFAAGLSAVAIGVYLEESGVPGATVGIIFTLALVGTMVLTAIVAFWGDRIGRRRLLVAGGLLMVPAALIPFFADTPILVGLLGLSGVVSVTASDSTGLQSVDQAALPQTVPDERRTGAFAAYNVVASAGVALGALSVGPISALGSNLGFAGGMRFIPAFLLIAICGLVSAGMALAMDQRIESGPSTEVTRLPVRSRGTIVGLSALFGLDSFASGLAVPSFVAYWFASRFGLPAGEIGLLFAVGQVLGALSFPVAAVLARRIGLIRTMVFTHIPASIFLILMVFVPTASLAAVLYLARAFLAQMDVPARSSYVMAVVDPHERTAASGITNLAKTASQAVGPLVAASLLIPIGLGVPIVACGVLKITYDLALYAGFRSRPAPEEVR